MKLKSLLIGASAIGLAASAQAQTTVINITGATAFRAAAHAAIVAAFGERGALGTSYNYAINNTNASNAGFAIYKGSFPGIPGTTVIRTSWQGSVEGVSALTKNTSWNYLRNSDSTNLTGFTSGVKTNASDFEASTSHQFAFSDMAQAAAPSKYAIPKLSGGPVGVIAFVPVINEGADAGITNITINQFRRLVSIGKIPASMLSGSNSTTGDIYHVQRNDGSGTRVIQLAEIGHGQANLTKGYVFGNFTLASAPVLFPASGNLSVYGISSGSDRTAFSNDYATTSVAGNGGYKSGGSIATLMGQVSSGFTGNIVSWLGTPDAINAVTAGARVLAYNGEKLDGIATGNLSNNDMSAADKSKIALGKYSAWSFEQLFYVGTAATGTPKKVVYDKLKSLIPSNLSGAGVSLAEMSVTRTTDGGTIAPK